MTTTEVTVTDAQRLTVLKHLAGGKDLDVTATVTHLPRSVVLDIGSKHGYPDRDKLGWAVDVVEKRIDKEAATLPAPKPQPPGTRAAPVDDPQTSRPAASTPAGRDSGPLTRPDEIRVLLNTAKAHPSKRIQNAANTVFDRLDRLRELIAEDERKNAETRARNAAKQRARAEVKRLEAELKAAREKLRGEQVKKVERTPAATQPDVPSAADLRVWARQADIECPSVGRIPRHVREAYDDAHRKADVA